MIHRGAVRLAHTGRLYLVLVSVVLFQHHSSPPANLKDELRPAIYKVVILSLQKTRKKALIAIYPRA